MTDAYIRVISNLPTRGDSEDCCGGFCGVIADLLDFCKGYHSVVVDISWILLPCTVRSWRGS